MAFQASTAAKPLTPNTYAVYLDDAYCIGSGKLSASGATGFSVALLPRSEYVLIVAVPNGGYITAVMLSAVSTHFSGTLKHLNQPDTMTTQLQFLRRTSVGPGVITIQQIKLGSTVSVVHATLSQDGREEIVGYFTQSNFEKMSGLSETTSFDKTGLEPAPLPVNLRQLEQTGEDANWTLLKNPFSQFRRAGYNIQYYHPRHGPIGPHNGVPRPSDPSTVDEWIRFRPGGKELAPFTPVSLGFVVDMFALIIEQYKPQEGPLHEPRWYPTVAINIEFKRRLPPGGADWLFARIRSLGIKDGRFDMQVTVLDADGNLVALSSHVALILSTERNTAARGRGAPKGDEGKRENKL